MKAIEHYFDDLYQQDDPYGFRERWYEARKRSILLATLPHRRFGTAWELGCSNGELTAALAERCDTLLATDMSAGAVELARRRTEHAANVTVEQATHPDDWPVGEFDLIVFSEVGYFMTSTALNDCIRRIGASLTSGGVVVACHWQHSFAEAVIPPAEVQQRFGEGLGLPHMFRYRDGDVLLEGWSKQLISVAALEGLA